MTKPTPEARPKLTKAEIKRAKDAAEMRRVVEKLLERHGGRFHGPNVEHLSMEEQAFWRFIEDVVGVARGAQLL